VELIQQASWFWHQICFVTVKFKLARYLQTAPRQIWWVLMMGISNDTGNCTTSLYKQRIRSRNLTGNVSNYVYSFLDSNCKLTSIIAVFSLTWKPFSSNRHPNILVHMKTMYIAFHHVCHHYLHFWFLCHIRWSRVWKGLQVWSSYNCHSLVVAYDSGVEYAPLTGSLLAWQIRI